MTIPKEVAEWLTGRDTGSSAINIVKHHYKLNTKDYNYPLDYGDFGRCYRMMKLFSFISIKCMAEVNPVWKEMVKEWDTLTEIYEDYLKTKDKNFIKEFDLIITKCRIDGDEKKLGQNHNFIVMGKM